MIAKITIKINTSLQQPERSTYIDFMIFTSPLGNLHYHHLCSPWASPDRGAASSSAIWGPYETETTQVVQSQHRELQFRFRRPALCLWTAQKPSISKHTASHTARWQPVAETGTTHPQRTSIRLTLWTLNRKWKEKKENTSNARIHHP
jgi:hypothetical protein